MNAIKLVVVGGGLALGFVAPAAAGPLEDGRSAFEKGDYATALELLHPAAEAGVAEAERDLGFIYTKGMGVPVDVPLGLSWWTKAAAVGDDAAQNALGGTYQFGHGVSIDYIKAAYWYELTTQRGNPYGAYNLGSMAAAGQGGPQDYIHAYMWSDLAIQFGLSGTRFKDLGLQLRTLAADHLTSAQMAEAMRLETDWLSQHPAAVRPAGTGYYPLRAQHDNVSGFVQYRCKATPGGALIDCVVLSENPEGYGFGDATIRVATEKIILSPEQKASLTPDGYFTGRMNWKVPPP